MHPYEILGGYWKITLPTGRDGKAEEVSLPMLEIYTGPHFYVNATGDGVVFRSPTRGPKTSNKTKAALAASHARLAVKMERRFAALKAAL